MAAPVRGLGPWCVGVRVVVRRSLPGEAGPTGGAAMTDLLGVLEHWGDHTITVRPESGEPVVIERRTIVSGKPVPPRPSVRRRQAADQVALRAADSWPALETERLGDWLLRASAGFSRRGNSALAAGAPDRPLDEALDAVVGFYASRGLPPQAQVVNGSHVARALAGRGWLPDRTVLDVEVRLAGVSQLLRASRPADRQDGPHVRLEPHVGDEWLADDERALEHRAAAVAVLEGPPERAFATVRDGAGSVLAKGRVTLSPGGEVWTGITDLWVALAHRREGLARTVLHAMASWAAERGATTAYLQTTADNGAARALYESVGFVTHHTYRYLTAPGCGP